MTETGVSRGERHCAERERRTAYQDFHSSENEFSVCVHML